MESKLCHDLTKQTHKGFTLVELVIAIGIFSFAIVGVLGLFPVAMQTTADAQNIMLASQIVRSVMTDLRGNMTETAGTNWSTAITPPATSGNNPNMTGLTLPLDTASTSATSAYAVFDDSGRIVRAVTSGNYTNGYTPPAANITDPISAFMVRVESFPVPSIIVGEPPSLSRVEVSIEYPAGGAADSRKKQEFITILGRLL